MEWISVEDKLPEFEKNVLAFDTQRIYIAYRHTEDEYNEHWRVPQDGWTWGLTSAVSHWMPLPEPPKQDA